MRMARGSGGGDDGRSAARRPCGRPWASAGRTRRRRRWGGGRRRRRRRD
uniref:Uncharacterized protein n=1 Tax=Arundo donax TaxID=35708 RepID=A0A0A9B2U7_ARUDO